MAADAEQDFGIGQGVFVELDGIWYDAEIQGFNSNGTLRVQYDSDGSYAEVAAGRVKAKAGPEMTAVRLDDGRQMSAQLSLDPPAPMIDVADVQRRQEEQRQAEAQENKQSQEVRLSQQLYKKQVHDYKLKLLQQQKQMQYQQEATQMTPEQQLQARILMQKLVELRDIVDKQEEAQLSQNAQTIAQASDSFHKEPDQSATTKQPSPGGIRSAIKRAPAQPGGNGSVPPQAQPSFPPSAQPDRHVSFSTMQAPYQGRGSDLPGANHAHLRSSDAEQCDPILEEIRAEHAERERQQQEAQKVWDDEKQKRQQLTHSQMREAQEHSQHFGRQVTFGQVMAAEEKRQTYELTHGDGDVLWMDRHKDGSGLQHSSMPLDHAGYIGALVLDLPWRKPPWNDPDELARYSQFQRARRRNHDATTMGAATASEWYQQDHDQKRRSVLGGPTGEYEAPDHHLHLFNDRPPGGQNQGCRNGRQGKHSHPTSGGFPGGDAGSGHLPGGKNSHSANAQLPDDADDLHHPAFSKAAADSVRLKNAAARGAGDVAIKKVQDVGKNYEYGERQVWWTTVPVVEYNTGVTVNAEFATPSAFYARNAYFYDDQPIRNQDWWTMGRWVSGQTYPDALNGGDATAAGESNPNGSAVPNGFGGYNGGAGAVGNPGYPIDGGCAGGARVGGGGVPSAGGFGGPGVVGGAGFPGAGSLGAPGMTGGGGFPGVGGIGGCPGMNGGGGVPGGGGFVGGPGMNGIDPGAAAMGPPASGYGGGVDLGPNCDYSSAFDGAGGGHADHIPNYSQVNQEASIQRDHQKPTVYQQQLHNFSREFISISEIERFFVSPQRVQYETIA